MTEIYDMVLMVGDLVLILVFFWFIAEAGLFFLDEFSGASSRIIQEYVSGYASMSNFAPAAFAAESVFPAVNHMMEISESPQFVFIKVGTRGTTNANPMTGEQAQPNAIMLNFVQKTPLSYFLSNAVLLSGDCMNNFCAFSGESQNTIRMKKDYSSVQFLLNRESAATGALYKLGDRIFYGECGSKTYSVDYMYAGTDSMHVQVKENEKIIKEGGNPTIEVKIGETKTIGGIKTTLYSIDSETNIASIKTECA